MSPPERSATCDAQIQVATDFEFSLENRLKAGNFVWGMLDDQNELVFWIENLPKDGTGCPGWWMFDRMMEHFGDRVAAIQGNWSFGDNLATVNSLTAAGQSLESAAVQGPTGRYAGAHGFRRVTVVAITGVPGSYSWVRVLFQK